MILSRAETLRQTFVMHNINGTWKGVSANRGGVENQLKCSAMLHTFRRHTAGCVDDLYAPPDAKFSASLGVRGTGAVALCSRIRTLMYECVRYLQPFTGDTDSCWHNSCELPFGFGQPGQFIELNVDNIHIVCKYWRVKCSNTISVRWYHSVNWCVTTSPCILDY